MCARTVQWTNAPNERPRLIIACCPLSFSSHNAMPARCLASKQTLETQPLAAPLGRPQLQARGLFGLRGACRAMGCCQSPSVVEAMGALIRRIT